MFIVVRRQPCVFDRFGMELVMARRILFWILLEHLGFLESLFLELTSFID